MRHVLTLFLLTILIAAPLLVLPLVAQAQAQLATDNPIPGPNMLRLPSQFINSSSSKTVTSSSAVTTTLPSHVQITQTSKPTATINNIIQAGMNPYVYDKIKGCATDQHTPTTYVTYLTHFSCGHIHIAPNGTIFRTFVLNYDDYHGVGKPIQISAQNGSDPVLFHAWLVNGSLPGPTMRMSVGDHIIITLVNSKDSAFTHNFHMHNIHPADADGMMGPSSLVFPGANYTYRFTANPAGVYPWHCHMLPTQEHINRGLFGTMIIDPATPRQSAVEMVMTLNGFSYNWQDYRTGTPHVSVSFPCTAKMLKTNQTGCQEESSDDSQPDNQFYSVNGMAFGYDIPHPIVLHVNIPYRIYLTNMLEFEPLNSFHIHANMFYFYQSGTFPSAPQYTDTIMLGQGQRGIVQLEFPFPGLYFFHSHINHQSDLGWQGFFLVEPK
jgi:manganese oxidase